mgnify:CR=1 FL=1
MFAIFSLEVGSEPDGEWIDSQRETPLDPRVVFAIRRVAPQAVYGEIVIPFLSDWYYAPQTYDSPADGDDERLLYGLAYFYVEREKFYFTPAESEMLFDEYEERIQECEVDTTPYGGPDEY